MNVALFSTKQYDIRSFDQVNADFGFELTYFDTRLTSDTAALADGFDAVCVFVNDEVDRAVIEQLAGYGVQAIATRSAGFNQIDLEAADEFGVPIVRVPAYSPNAVSEFTVGLILTLGRQIHRAYNRVRENNFDLEGLVGFELQNKVVGVFGTGKIGATVIQNLSGFGPRILAYDLYRNTDIEHLVEYYDDPAALFRQADILTFHLPLMPETHHLINRETIAQLKDGVFIVNTSRGGLLDTEAVIEGLKSGKIGYLAIDVYEVEDELFFQDLSNQILADDVFARLQTFPNVLVTGHQAFLTNQALYNIAETTLQNLQEIAATGRSSNQIQLSDLTSR